MRHEVSLLRPLPELAQPAFRGAASIFVLLLVAATILRLIDLGDGMWLDELDTLVHYVRKPLAYILTTFDSKNQHVLYSVLAHWSVQVFGESAWALRLPAVLLGVVSIGALAWFGAIVTSRVESLAAAALLTFSYHHVWFSQNARGYTGLLLATLVASGLLLRMTSSTRWRWPLSIGYAVTMGLAIYIHLTAILIVAGHVVWWSALAVRNRDRAVLTVALVPAAAFAMTAILALLLYLPVLGQLLPTLTAPSMGGTTAEWKNPVWFALETIRGLGRGVPGSWLTLVVAASIAALGVGSYAKRSAAVTWLMILPAVVTAAAVLGSGQNLWPRFFFFAAGFGALIVIRGVFAAAELISPARATLFGSIASGMVVLGSATTVPRAWNPKQDYAGARAFVDRSRGENDAVVTADLTEFPYRDYYGLDWPAVENREQLRAIERSDARTWVLLTFPLRFASVKPDLWRYIQDRYAKAEVFPGTVGGGEIIVMVTR